jgi:hypothetical protein
MRALMSRGAHKKNAVIPSEAALRINTNTLSFLAKPGYGQTQERCHSEQSWLANKNKKVVIPSGARNPSLFLAIRQRGILRSARNDGANGLGRYVHAYTTLK